MDNKKRIRDLTNTTTAPSNDDFLVLDNGTTNKITRANLLAGTPLPANITFADGGGVFTDTEYFTSSGTYTKPANLKFVIVEVQGGGGGGGGKSGTASGGSGSAGSYTKGKILASEIGSTETVTVGGGGAAGTDSPSAGGNGGNSSFGSHLICGGGAGGPASNVGAPPAESSVITPGDFSVVGQIGSGRSTSILLYSNGGSSHLGSGGLAHNAGSHDAYGYGGGGAAGGGGQNAGGAGAEGIVIVHEYF